MGKGQIRIDFLPLIPLSWLIDGGEENVQNY